MRVRSNDGAETVVSERSVLINGALSHKTGGTKTSMIREESMQDEVIPDFRKRIKAGEVINNAASRCCDVTHWPLFDTYNKYYSYNTRYEVQGTTGAYEVYPAKPDLLELSSSELESMAAEAFSNARSRVADAAVGYAETLAEWRQTVDMFTDTLKSVVKFTRLAKAKKWKALKYPKNRKLAKDAANAWLQYRYGVRPLISEVCNTLDAFRTKVQLRQTARYFDVYQDFDSQEYEDTNRYSTVKVSGSVSKSVDIQTSAGCMFDFLNTNWELANRFGFNDLFTLGWELVPYSFVIDWFIPIGDMLSFMVPKVGYNIRASWTKVAITSTTTKTIERSPQGAGVEATGRCTITRKKTSWSRVPRATDFVYQAPILQANVNLQRLLDGMALLRQLR